ncbi:hypothetical protein KDJ56_10215 [Brevibacillus composti]|uniref:Uncharacterized protein n=1 Tax=Brevibacillus composti TaxID=2796470 RepID=A0A7T5EQ64_9BACL|nr:hypothetical protein [Brevibacillus composti]QQE76751.1 hypothetical protein JD108_10525 [Brevibacillus composti]QUO43818.1 hypothetical protein KDJ56_10215 [Brevibacillus composti]
MRAVRILWGKRLLSTRQIHIATLEMIPPKMTSIHTSGVPTSSATTRGRVRMATPNTVEMTVIVN